MLSTVKPGRLFISSKDAVVQGSPVNPGNFQIQLREPIDGAQGIQLLSARIPLVLPQIPAHESAFCYILTKWDGSTSYRVFFLNQNANQPAYISNYGALVDQLNEAATYWSGIAPDVDLGAALLQASPPDIKFSYDANTRLIGISNVSPAPSTLALRIMPGVNDTFLVYNSQTDAYTRPVIASGTFTTLADLATAIQAACANAGVPIAVTANGTYLNYSSPSAGWQLVSQGVDPGNQLSNAQLTAVSAVIGQPIPTVLYLSAAGANSTLPIAFTEQLPAPTLQLASVADTPSMLSPRFLKAPNLCLNRRLGWDMAQRAPRIPLRNDGVTIAYPPSWADLVRTQSIYVVTNLTTGTNSSANRRDIMEVIGVDAPTLGVVSYMASHNHYNKNVQPVISTVEIKLLDEQGLPLSLPQNVLSEFTFGLTY